MHINPIKLDINNVLYLPNLSALNEQNKVPETIPMKYILAKLDT